jgi:drug/metabolite transporter (DMT)-like permease
VCLFWGTTYLGIRMALESFPPATLVAIRFTLSGAIMLVAALLRGDQIPRGRELGTAVLTGVVTLGIGNGSLAWAEQLIPSGLASLFITLSPFYLVGIEAMFPGGERLHLPTVAGMLVGFAGTALLFFPGSSGGAINATVMTGFFITQMGVSAWCLGSIYQKQQTARAHPIVTGAVQQLAAGLVFAPIAMFLPAPPIVLKARAIGAVFYLAAFGSIIGYSAYVYALDRLPVALVSIYPYINAVVAVSLGWLFYREAFGSREIISMAVIFAGVGLVKWQTVRRHKSLGPQFKTETLDTRISSE